MEVSAALAASALLAALAGLQVAAALGARVGHLVWGGQHRVLPTVLRVGSAVSVVAYALMAVLLLARADLVPPGPGGWIDVATWVLTGYLALGVVLNGASRSRPERATMVPACLVLAACAGLLAAS